MACTRQVWSADGWTFCKLTQTECLLSFRKYLAIRWLSWHLWMTKSSEVTPAMPTGCSHEYIMDKMPDKAFDVGIAEGHAVTFSGGMAKDGLIPFCNIYSSFSCNGHTIILFTTWQFKKLRNFCLDRAGTGWKTDLRITACSTWLTKTDTQFDYCITSWWTWTQKNDVHRSTTR